MPPLTPTASPDGEMFMYLLRGIAISGFFMANLKTVIHLQIPSRYCQASSRLPLAS